MREIKFRYRFKNRKTGEEFTTVLTIFDIEIRGFTPRVFEGFDWEVLSRDQYTGLKDKTGKEIYEGDILKAPNGLSVISYDPPRFVASEEYDECFVGFADTWEIVGNVYENPELLKP